METKKSYKVRKALTLMMTGLQLLFIGVLALASVYTILGYLDYWLKMSIKSVVYTSMETSVEAVVQAKAGDMQLLMRDTFVSSKFIEMMHHRTEMQREGFNTSELLRNIPQYYQEHNGDTSFPKDYTKWMWLKDPSVTSLDQLTPAERYDVDLCAYNSFSVFSTYTTQYGDANIPWVYMGFEQSHMFCETPLEVNSFGNRGGTYHCPNGDTKDYYDPTCRYWYYNQKAKKSHVTFSDLWTNIFNETAISVCAPILQPYALEFYAAYCIDVYSSGDEERELNYLLTNYFPKRDLAYLFFNNTVEFLSGDYRQFKEQT